MTEEQLQFHTRRDLERRIFINYTRNIVLVFRNAMEKQLPDVKPYVIMTIEQFRRHFKI